jgi:hypothetical protein
MMHINAIYVESETVPDLELKFKPNEIIEPIKPPRLYATVKGLSFYETCMNEGWDDLLEDDPKYTNHSSLLLWQRVAGHD